MPGGSCHQAAEQRLVRIETTDGLALFVASSLKLTRVVNFVPPPRAWDNTSRVKPTGVLEKFVGIIDPDHIVDRIPWEVFTLGHIMHLPPSLGTISCRNFSTSKPLAIHPRIPLVSAIGSCSSSTQVWLASPANSMTIA